MYTELKMQIESDRLTYKNMSNLQGVIMENISQEYAAKLHLGNLNPYSQFLLSEKGAKSWFIMTLDQEAYEKLILPMTCIDSFEIKDGEIKGNIISRNIEICTDKDFAEAFYRKKTPRYFTVRFFSPTAFKRKGKYVNYPDLRLIFQSLMRKYDAASQKFEMMDEEVLEQLVRYSEIVRYHLRTVSFPMEGICINGFVGTIVIHMSGPETLTRYARMLLSFGKYSGIGIKTGMGMGAMRLLERRDKSE